MARARAAKNKPAEPVPDALVVLPWIARLNAGAEQVDLAAAWNAMAVAVAENGCRSELMPAAACEMDLTLAREWLGWIDLRRGNLVAALREFAAPASPAWRQWVAGRQAFEGRHYREAAEQYRGAVALWDADRRRTAVPVVDRLKPQPDAGAALTELGAATLLAGDAAGAVAVLDRAVKAEPDNAHAIYLRARAKEAAGETEAALADLNLASRTAFASPGDVAAGEAHLYRGILLYRRKDFARAEDEFASALNLHTPPSLERDAVAWRHLAAVAAGSCADSRRALERSLGVVSPYFPKEEATRRIAACPAGGTGE
jgi:tetratricopeptide (TPR) repeat protein